MNAAEVSKQTMELWNLVLQYAPPVLGALVVLFVGRAIANWLYRLTNRGLEKTKIDVTLKPVIAAAVRYVALGLTILIVLQQFGVQTASLLAILGTIGLAIGLALQGTLSNVAAGLMLLFLRPFEVGDRVVAGGSEGVVLGIDMFHTNLRTNDGVNIYVPNSAILGGAILNMSSFPERIVSVSLNMSLDTDPDLASKVVREALASQDNILQDRESTVAIKSLTGGGYELGVSAWVRDENYAAARTNLLRAVRERFAASGVKLA